MPDQPSWRDNTRFKPASENGSFPGAGGLKQSKPGQIGI